MDSPYHTIDVRPLSGALGAEIGDVDIASGLDDEQFAEIYRAFADYSVILFRNQSLTQEQHIAFAQRWGVSRSTDFLRRTENPIIAEVAKRTRSETILVANGTPIILTIPFPHSARFSTHEKFPSLVAIRCLPVCTELTKPSLRGCGKRLKT